MTDFLGCLGGCGKVGSAARGLCSNCYRIASERVKAGKTTWRALELLGKASPPVRRYGHAKYFGQNY